MKSVIFDLDGTLVESHKDIAASINFVRERRYGLPPLDAQRIATLLHQKGINTAKALYGVETYEKGARTLFEAHYSRYCIKNCRLYEGVEDVLKELVQTRCRLFVATNAPTATSEKILKYHGIAHYFTDIVGADRVELPKPNPAMIRHIMAQSLYDEIWMVGDSEKDMEAALQAGIKGVFVKWGYGHLSAHLHDECHCIDTPSHLLGILFQNFE